MVVFTKLLLLALSQYRTRSRRARVCRVREDHKTGHCLPSSMEGGREGEDVTSGVRVDATETGVSPACSHSTGDRLTALRKS